MPYLCRLIEMLGIEMGEIAVEMRDYEEFSGEYQFLSRRYTKLDKARGRLVWMLGHAH